MSHKIIEFVILTEYIIKWSKNAGIVGALHAVVHLRV